MSSAAEPEHAATPLPPDQMADVERFARVQVARGLPHDEIVAMLVDRGVSEAFADNYVRRLAKAVREKWPQKPARKRWRPSPASILLGLLVTGGAWGAMVLSLDGSIPGGRYTVYGAAAVGCLIALKGLLRRSAE